MDMKFNRDYDTPDPLTLARLDFPQWEEWDAAEPQSVPPFPEDDCDISGFDLRLPIAQGEDLFRDFIARRLCA